jgi:hypothetical protein
LTFSLEVPETKYYTEPGTAEDGAGGKTLVELSYLSLPQYLGVETGLMYSAQDKTTIYGIFGDLKTNKTWESNFPGLCM